MTTHVLACGGSAATVLMEFGPSDLTIMAWWQDPFVDSSGLQRAICDRVGVRPSPPRASSMIGIAPSRSRDLVPLHALRQPPQGQSNGWYAWRGDDIPQDDTDFSVPLHIEHLADHEPDLVPYLALPPGWRVLLDYFPLKK
jgi:hypothetical protein